MALELETIAGWNDKAARMLGWSASEVLAKRVGDVLIAPAERPAYAEWARRTRGSHLTCPLHDFTALHRDGWRFPALFKLLAQTWSEQGRQYVLSMRAISDQVYAREQPFSVESSRALLETLPVGVWITDRQGNIVQTNTEALRIWAGANYVNIPRYGEYKGWWPTGERIQAEEWAMARALNKGETVLNEVIRIEAFDGTTKTIINSASPIRNSRNEVIGAVSVNQDVTELKRLQEHLERQHAELESRVNERTLELSKANELLKSEVADRSRVEADLHNEKEFLTAVLNNMEDGIVACDANGLLDCIQSGNP